MRQQRRTDLILNAVVEPLIFFMNVKVVQLWRHSVKYIEREPSGAASPRSLALYRPPLFSSSHEYEWHLTSEEENRHVVTPSASLFFPLSLHSRHRHGGEPSGEGDSLRLRSEEPDSVCMCVRNGERDRHLWLAVGIVSEGPMWGCKIETKGLSHHLQRLNSLKRNGLWVMKW